MTQSLEETLVTQMSALNDQIVAIEAEKIAALAKYNKDLVSVKRVKRQIFKILQSMNPNLPQELPIETHVGLSIENDGAVSAVM